MSERIKQLDARIDELQAERQARDVIFVARIKRLLDSPEVIALKNRCPIARLKHVIVEWESYRQGEEAEYNDLMKQLVWGLRDEDGWTCPHCGTEWHDGWHVCHHDECVKNMLKTDPLYTETEPFKAAKSERSQE